MGWVIVGLCLFAFYTWVFCVMIVASDADDQSMRDWERQQREWRRDDR